MAGHWRRHRERGTWIYLLGPRRHWGLLSGPSPAVDYALAAAGCLTRPGADSRRRKGSVTGYSVKAARKND